MSILPIPLVRVSNQLRSNVAATALARTQQQLLDVQNQISTGKRVNSPSDDPASAAVIQQLQKTLEQRDGYAANLQYGQSQLGEVDSTLGDLTDLLTQAQTVASANVGSDVTADARKAAAAVVDSIYRQALTIGNKQFDGVYLFAGDKSTSPPFAEQNGVMTFVGSQQVLSNQYDENTSLSFMVDGAKVFGALSTRVQGAADLAPVISATTRLSDLGGAAGNGVSRGSIRINNGSTSTLVNLANADTVGDVVNAINAAGISGVTATLGAGGIDLGGGAGNITVGESGGSTAADLGLLTPAGGAGGAVTGQNLKPAVTPLTPLADLRGGAGLDPAGITVSDGTNTTAIGLAGATTVQDLLNRINGSGAGVLARINAAGNGIDVVNPKQGGSMRIAENGGTTAAQLGVGSFGPSTPLSELNGGAGVRTVAGTDFQVTRSNGTTFAVDVDGSKTLQDVVNAINAADAGGGVTASFSNNGNGIVLTDTAGGAGSPAVTPLNASSAAADLGLAVAASGNTITGGDVNAVPAGGVLANLARLRDALDGNNATAITAAAEDIKADFDRVNLSRGQVGARVQEMQTRQGRMDDENLATKSLLSNLQDVDFTQAITQFQTLQTALQATLQTTAKTLNLSLLQFLG